MKTTTKRDRSIDQQLSRTEVMIYSFLMGLFVMAVIHYQMDRHLVITAQLEQMDKEWQIEQQREEERRLYSHLEKEYEND